MTPPPDPSVSPADTPHELAVKIRRAIGNPKYRENSAALAALAALLAVGERDRQQVARLTEALEQIAGIDLVKYVGAPLLEVQHIARAVLADEEDARPEQNVTEGMPPDLVRALRDPTIRLPQDDYKLADGRSLWEHLQEWRNAPSDTAPADLRAAGEGDT